MLPILLRLMRDDDGQDVVEYALLTAAIGIVGVASWPLIEVGIKNGYKSINRRTQDAWEVPDPGSN
jgi:Flp pilus assembly pilin Flp